MLDPDPTPSERDAPMAQPKTECYAVTGNRRPPNARNARKSRREDGRIDSITIVPSDSLQQHLVAAKSLTINRVPGAGGFNNEAARCFLATIDLIKRRASVTLGDVVESILSGSIEGDA